MNVYTYTDANGHAHQVAPGQDFTSQVQRIDTPEESAFSLGAPVGSYVPCAIQHRAGDLDNYGDELLARWGITRTETPDAPVQVGPRTCSVYELMYGRMNQAERIFLRGSADPIVQDFHEALNMVPRVELDADFTVEALGYLESKNYIKPGRAAEILA